MDGRARWITSFSLIVLSRGTPRKIEWRIGGRGQTPSSFLSYLLSFFLLLGHHAFKNANRIATAKCQGEE